MARSFFPYHSLVFLLYGVSVLAPLVGSDASTGNMKVVGDYLALLAKITSARLEEEIETHQQDGSVIRYRISLLTKGPLYKVIRTDVINGQPLAVGLTYVANKDGWQYLEGLRELCLVHKDADKHGFGDVPLGDPMPTPMLLVPIQFLGYQEHLATTSLRIPWNRITDKAWLGDRWKDTVTSVEGETAGDIVIHVPHTSPKRISDTEFIEVVQDLETRFVVRVFPEFGGARFVHDIQWCQVGTPADNHTRITYKSFMAKDGSGSYPLPAEVVETDDKDHVTNSRKLLSAEINVPIDDSEFEIDPTRVKTIHDFANEGGVVPVRGEGASEAAP